MQQRETLQVRVYNDILTRIREGEFPNGSSLPTLKELSKQYHVSDNCIRMAIGYLKENGYLSTKRGRPARIIYTLQPPEPEKQPYPAFSCNKKNHHSFYEAIHILFPSIYTHASLACTEGQLAELNQIIPLLASSEDTGSDYVDLNIRFFKIILSSVQNKLLLHIVQTVMQNAVLPAALTQKGSDQLEEEFLHSSAAMHHIYAAILENDSAYAKKQWQQLFEITESMVQKVNPGSRRIPGRENKVFTGLQYVDEFKYLLIAHDLYEKILEGKYPVGLFLPTISEAQKIYHAGKTTIQAAYRVLANLEIVTTIHGRGTKVIQLTFENIHIINKKTPHSRKHEYREAIEFLQIVCEDIILNVHSQSFQPLKDCLNSDLNPSHQYSALILCRYLMKETCDPALDTFYRVLSRRLYWGVHSVGVPGGISPEEKHCLCIKIVDALEQEQTTRAIDLTKELLNALYHNA